MRSDLALHLVVSATLRTALGAEGARIHITVRDGIVSLFGPVETTAERVAAADAVRHIAGVRALADGLYITESSELPRVS